MKNSRRAANSDLAETACDLESFFEDSAVVVDTFEELSEHRGFSKFVPSTFDEKREHLYHLLLANFEAMWYGVNFRGMFNQTALAYGVVEWVKHVPYQSMVAFVMETITPAAMEYILARNRGDAMTLSSVQNLERITPTCSGKLMVILQWTDVLIHSEIL